MSSLELRPVQPTDAPEVLAVMHRAHAWNLANGFNFTAADITADELAPYLNPAHLFVAVRAGRLVGTVEVKPEREPPDWGLHFLAVDPHAAGGGVGRALAALCEEVARAAGAPRLVLNTPEHHPWLPAFYRRLGYLDDGHVQWEGKNYRSVLLAKPL